ncbi:MAG: hypothetical protein KJ737_12970 [Proteobacteria bacterium]|nr:hypothetical protein [Pseudomonadota bacterium]
MSQKRVMIVIVVGILFFWGCSGGGKDSTIDNQAQTVNPDASGTVDDITPSPNKYVRLSHEDLILYVGETFDVTIIENKDSLDLGILTADDVTGSDNDFVVSAEINGDIVTVKATGEGYGQVELTYTGEDGHLRSAAHIDVVANLRGPEFYPLVSEIDHTGDGINCMARAGHYVYICSPGKVPEWGKPPDCKIYIIDIRDVTNPVLVKSFIVDPNLSLYDMDASDGFIYVLGQVPDTSLANDKIGVRIIDVRNPDTPTVICEYLAQNVPFYYHDGPSHVEYQNNRLYLHSSCGLEVLDVIDPSNPTPMGYYSYSYPGYWTPDFDYRGFSVEGNYAYIARYVERQGETPRKTVFSILDISDPGNIMMTGSTDIHPFTIYGSVGKENIHIAGKYAYVYDGPLHIIDIEDPYNPLVVTQTKTFQYDKFNPQDLFYNNGFIFSGNGLKILDVTHPEKSLQVSAGGTNQKITELELYGNYLLAAGPETFAIYDISFFTNYSH